MIVIDETPEGIRAAGESADFIEVCDLLAACAVEAQRLARAAGSLDASMGAVLSSLTQGGDRGKAGSVLTLLRELQETDLIRQELSGLARALDLAVAARSMSALVSAEQVRACTPLGALQNRLLSGCGPEPMRFD